MEAELLKAAFIKIKAVADSLNLPCYWPSVDGQNIPTNTYLRADVLAPTQQLLTVLGGVCRYQWILQVIVCVRSGIGAVIPNQLVDQLIAAIPCHTVLNNGGFNFELIRPGRKEQATASDGWYFVPVSFLLLAIN